MLARMTGRAGLIALMFAIGMVSGFSLYTFLLRQTKEIQSRNVTESIALIEQSLKSFDIVAMDNISRVLYGADYVVGLKVETGSGFVVFDAKKARRGESISYNFANSRGNGDVRQIGTVVIEVDHDPDATRNIVMSCLIGGLLGFLLARLFISARSLKDELAVRKASEVALREQEETLRILLNSLTEAVIATDSAGCVCQMNPVAEFLTGWPFSEAAGKPIESVFQLVDRKSGARPNVAPGGPPVSNNAHLGSENATLITRTGNECRVSHSTAPMIGSENRIAGAVIVFRDVTAEIQAQKAIREMEKMQAIGVLAGGIAHDYNNLLAIILSAAEVISIKDRERLTATSAKLLSTIVKTSRRGADLTARLLAVGSKPSGDQKPISLHASIENVVAVLRRTIDKKLDIKVKLAATSDWVLGDVSAIENVVLNIGLNASQAMKGDGGSFHVQTDSVCLLENDDVVRIHNAPVGPCIRMTLRDTGVGIPAENLSRIFEPFFTNRRGGGGLGLGLWMVYNTVRDHGGSIHVESLVGQETKFLVHLPVTSAPVAPANARPYFGGARNKTMLIVDDEDDMREACAQMLGVLGCHVRLATGGEEAIRLIKQQRSSIDAVVMDLNMPGMSGEDTVAEILRIDPTIPIAISSGYAATSKNAARKDHDKHLFLQKPYSLSDLDAMLIVLFDEKSAGRKDGRPLERQKTRIGVN